MTGMYEVISREEANRKKAQGVEKNPSVWTYIRKLELTVAEQQVKIRHLEAGLQETLIELNDVRTLTVQHDLQLQNK